MKISHRQLRLILRILSCLGIFFGLFVFIYTVLFQRNILYIICYICYFIVTAAVLYLLFARKRPSNRFAYGTFYGMCFVTVLFFLAYIYESVTAVSRVTNQLIDHIERDKEVDQPIAVLVRLSKCCIINDDRDTEENLLSFRSKYPETCGSMAYEDAQSCQPYIRNQRNFTILLCCIMVILRLLTLYLLWKYLNEEYNNVTDEIMSVGSSDGARSSTATSAA